MASESNDQMLLFVQSIDKITAIMRKGRKELLQTQEEKVALMFLEIVFNSNLYGTMKQILGVEQIQEIAASNSLDEVFDKIAHSNVFKYVWEDAYDVVKGFVEAWFGCQIDDELDVEEFLIQCIKVRSTNTSYAVGEAGGFIAVETIDEFERSILCERYGIDPKVFVTEQ